MYVVCVGSFIYLLGVCNFCTYLYAFVSMCVCLFVCKKE